MDDHRHSGGMTTRRHPYRDMLLRCWPLAQRVVPLFVIALVAWLLVRHAQSVDWAAVKQSLTNYSWWTLMAGGGLATSAYLVYASYDFFGRYYVGHGISRLGTLAIAFVCAGFTLNLGVLIGSIGLRYRLYSRWGVGKGEIAHIIGLAVTTNWLGYCLLTGLLLVTGKVAIPFDWDIGNSALRGVGTGFLAVVATYLLFCRFARKRSWELWGQTITLPSTVIACAQLLLASTHWSLMGATMYALLYGQVDYFTLLGVLLVSSIAGVITRVPGAMGVLEAVFLAFLGEVIGPSALIAALIAYRAVFYLWPLALALAGYGLMEISNEKSRVFQDQSGSDR